MNSIPVISQGLPDTSVWPFLVTRGWSVPYRVVLAPRFLVESGRVSLLMRATGESPDSGREIFKREVDDSRAGKFVIIFQIVPADPAIVGKPGDVLKDDGSRPVQLTEGIVVAGSGIAVSATILERVHLVVTDAFRVFWDSDNRFAEPESSQRLDLDGLPADEPLISINALPPLRYTGEAAEAQSGEKDSAALASDSDAVATEHLEESPKPEHPGPEPNGRRTRRLAAGAFLLIAIIIIMVLVLR